MVRVRVRRDLSDDDRTAVLGFLDAAHALDCAQLDDHLQSDLHQGPRAGFVAALATDDDGQLVGYAQASTGNDGFVIDSIVWSAFDGDVDAVRVSLLRTLLAELPAHATVTWWTHDEPSEAVLAASLGMQPHRRLLQMRRPLPIDEHAGVEVRGFRVGVDETAWLEVNNAAFSWHGEQGGWDLKVLQQREREPWFSADGFLLHERDGRLAAFCWTKLHRPEVLGDPLVGEIYVVAVHPDFHGTGLGRALTVAGLEHLHSVGATEGMLYVDGDNESAVHLYRKLGFSVAHIDVAHRLPSTGGSS